MTTAAETTLLRREALERRFDGPIPAHLLSPKSEREHMADHHRAMIRYSQVRIGDFEESLTKLRALPDSDETKAIWIARTLGNITDHRRELGRHEAELAALTGAATQAAAE